MGKVIGLKCATCGKIYPPDSGLFTCPDCGPYKGTLEVLYDYEELRKTLNRKNWINNDLPWHYRYINLLPFNDISLIPPLQVGTTPLIENKRLNSKYGFNILLKDDTRNSTLSYKDRASSIALIKALEQNAPGIIVASTGNAASSMAGFGASSGMPVYVLVPETIPEGKLLQLILYNAKVVKIEANYDRCFDLSMEIAKRTGLYLRSTAVNPYLSEGKKTSAFEIAEQTNYNLPDYVFVPVGDGCIIESVFKGFKELSMLNITEKIPKIIGVQAEGADPLTRTFQGKSSEITFMDKPTTIADSINVGVPRDGIKALKAVYESNGMFISVKDSEIIDAIKELAKETGIFVEPAAAAAFAGFKKARKEGKILPKSRVVILLTGHGLKDPASIKNNQQVDTPVLPPDIEKILKLLSL